MLPLNFKIFRRFEYGRKIPWNQVEHACTLECHGHGSPQPALWKAHHKYNAVEGGWINTLIWAIWARQLQKCFQHFCPTFDGLIFTHRGVWGNISKMNNEIILSLQGRMVKSAIHLVRCMWEEEVFKPSTQNIDSCLKKELHCVFQKKSLEIAWTRFRKAQTSIALSLLL